MALASLDFLIQVLLRHCKTLCYLHVSFCSNKIHKRTELNKSQLKLICIKLKLHLAQSSQMTIQNSSVASSMPIVSLWWLPCCATPISYHFGYWKYSVYHIQVIEIFSLMSSAKNYFLPLENIFIHNQKGLSFDVL